MFCFCFVIVIVFYFLQSRSLYCIVWYYTVLYCFILYCIVLYCTGLLYCIVLCCAALCCAFTALNCTATALHCIALHCTVCTVPMVSLYLPKRRPRERHCVQKTGKPSWTINNSISVSSCLLAFLILFTASSTGLFHLLMEKKPWRRGWLHWCTLGERKIVPFWAF